MSLSYKTFNYLSDFACLGDKCEDTCCKGWDIRFDKPHYELLKDTIENSSGELVNKFSKFITLNTGNLASDHFYAQLNLKNNGECPFLTSERWCELHQQYGEKPLSNICAFYPRVLSRYGDVVELSGALSCPEMVRKCLFGKDDVEMVEFDTSILPRPNDYPLTRELDLPADNFYYEKFVNVRQILHKLCDLEGFGLESRLYFMANFANRLGSIYSLETANDNSQLLENELKQALSVTMLERMDDYVGKYDTAEPIAIIVIQAVLHLRLQQFPDELYSKNLAKIFSNYESQMSEDDLLKVQDGTLPPEVLWQLYQEQRKKIDNVFLNELDRCFTRYTVNCLYREWFITMPDLFTYIHMLVIRLAVLRFLVYSQPEIQNLVQEQSTDNGNVSDETLSKLRERLVEIVYRNSRAIDHNSAFLKIIYDAIYEQQMMTYEYSLPFIKF